MRTTICIVFFLFFITLCLHSAAIVHMRSTERQDGVGHTNRAVYLLTFLYRQTDVLLSRFSPNSEVNIHQQTKLI